METFLYVLHISLSFVIVVVILMQSGQGGGLGAGFSNAAAVGQEVFGGRGAASFLGKLTWVLGFTFMATSMGLAWYSSQPQSALDLDMRADEPVQMVEHPIIDEGGAGAMPGGLPEDFMQQLEGMEGLEDMEGLDLQMLDEGGDGQPAFDLEIDDGAEMPEELQQQLDEMQQQLGEPGDAPTLGDAPTPVEVEPVEADEPVEVEEAVDPAPEVEIEEEAQPAEEAEGDE